MNFSTNQVRQFYVVSADPVVSYGGTGLKQIVDPNGSFASDLIDPKKITHIEYTKATELQVFNRYGETALADGVTPEVGKTYTFKIYMHDLYGAGDEYIQPIVASVEAKTTNALDLYKEIVKNLAPKAEVNTTGAGGKIKGYPLYIYCHSNGIGVETNLEEANNGWTNAVNPLKEVKFNICVDTEVWTKPTYGKGDKEFASGYKLAELEYFCMGERGDQYRMMGYPNHIVTKYNIVPTTEYDVIDIMYYHTDNKEGVQRSEKVITLAIPASVNTDGEPEGVSQVVTSILNKFNVDTTTDDEGLDNLDENTIVTDEDFLS